jgi:argininosuccinate lyase
VGRARAVLEIMHNTPFTDMNDSEGETQAFGHQAFETAGRVLDLLCAFVPELRIEGARVAQNISRSCITITELADTLVRGEGLSFREAHEIASAVARKVVAAGGDLGADGYAAFAAAFGAATGREPGLDAAAFAHAVSAEHFVAVRNRFGGPAPEALHAALAAYRAERAGLAERLGASRAREAAGASELDARFNALAETS